MGVEEVGNSSHLQLPVPMQHIVAHIDLVGHLVFAADGCDCIDIAVALLGAVVVEDEVGTVAAVEGNLDGVYSPEGAVVVVAAECTGMVEPYSVDQHFDAGATDSPDENLGVENLLENVLAELQ